MENENYFLNSIFFFKAPMSHSKFHFQKSTGQYYLCTAILYYCYHCIYIMDNSPGNKVMNKVK